MFFTIPNFFERMLEEPFSPLTVLSISAIITTISLFFCGIPICLQIFRRGSTHEISGFPFLMGFLGGVFWLRYGFMKKDLTMVTVNCVGVSLMSLYLLFYLYFSRPRIRFLAQLTFIGLIVSAMLTLVHIYQMDVLNPLGFVCMTFNIMNFGAPLAGLTVVLRDRSCATLPLPLCIANLLVSSQWCVYGVLVNDIFIIIPNGAGVILAMLQINLFLIFPRKSGSKAPLARCCQCVEALELADERLRLNHHPHHRPPRTVANKFMHRQRVIDRRLIPTSRAACIAFLRANGFDASAGSVTSRSTTDSWMSNSLSRISSHYSHPELWTPSSGVVERADGDGAETLYTVDSAVHLPQTLSSDGPSTSLLSSSLQRTPAADPSYPIYEFDRSRELEDHWKKGQWTNDDREQIIRTLSAPDLAQRQQMLKWEQEQQQEQQQRHEGRGQQQKRRDNP